VDGVHVFLFVMVTIHLLDIITETELAMDLDVEGYPEIVALVLQTQLAKVFILTL